MAWRIEDNLIRAEFDFRAAGKVLGHLWLDGMELPVTVLLDGLPHQDLQGQRLIVHHRGQTCAVKDGFSQIQEGMAGDMTASRRVKVPDVSADEMHQLVKSGKEFPWHWGNALYLEWFSNTNGRVVLESTKMELRINDASSVISVAAATDEDDDAPQSKREAEADAYSEYMNALTDRVAIRLEKGEDFENYETIFREERKKLRSQYGFSATHFENDDGDENDINEPDDDSLWQEEWEDTDASIEDLMQEENQEDAWKTDEDEECDTESWSEDDPFLEGDHHPLVNAALLLNEQIFRVIQENGWLPEVVQHDHPLEMLHHSVMFAGVKLSGALMDADEQWPPEEDEAAHVIVALKAARRHFRDALLALESCKEEHLAESIWLNSLEAEITLMLAEVNDFIQESRDVIADSESKE